MALLWMITNNALAINLQSQWLNTLVIMITFLLTVLNVLGLAIWINSLANFGFISLSTIDLLGPGQHFSSHYLVPPPPPPHHHHQPHSHHHNHQMHFIDGGGETSSPGENHNPRAILLCVIIVILIIFIMAVIGHWSWSTMALNDNKW